MEELRWRRSPNSLADVVERVNKGKVLTDAGKRIAAVSQRERDKVLGPRLNLFGERVNRPSLTDKFLIPPFSVLDTRQGYWLARKRVWVQLGIRGEEGREASISGAPMPLDPVKRQENVFASDKRKVGVSFATDSKADWDRAQAQKKRPTGVDHNPGWGVNGAPSKKPGYAAPGGGGTGGWLHHVDGKTAAYSDLQKKVGQGQPEINGIYGSPVDAGTSASNSGTSVFDPVLCELAYRWFCPTNGSILDPFAGESTKGIVAACLGYQYTGVELRQEQIDANNRQARSIDVSPTWIKGDSAQIKRILPRGQQYDLIFTSPPYYDLEVYEGGDKDGSGFGTYEQFMEWYTEIFAQCVARLKDNRFLVVKVGEIRDRKTGIYRNFVGDNIQVFRKLGLHYYNEMILLTSVGSLPIRCTLAFNASRKIGKTHQNIQVYFKGDPKSISHEFPKFS